MKTIKTFVALAALLCTGCASARLTALPEASENVFISKLPERAYREVAFAEATGSIFTTRRQLLRKLQQQQARLQGDALVQVQQGFVFWWPHASAVVVKYQ